MDNPPGEIYQVEDQKGVQVTRPDGTPIYINPRYVAYIRAPLKSEGGNAVIVFSNGTHQAVLETVDTLMKEVEIVVPGEEDEP